MYDVEFLLELLGLVEQKVEHIQTLAFDVIVCEFQAFEDEDDEWVEVLVFLYIEELVEVAGRRYEDSLDEVKDLLMFFEVPLFDHSRLLVVLETVLPFSLLAADEKVYGVYDFGYDIDPLSTEMLVVRVFAVEVLYHPDNAPVDLSVLLLPIDEPFGRLHLVNILLEGLSVISLESLDKLEGSRLE